MLLLYTALAQDPWEQWQSRVVSVNTCYNYQTELSNSLNQKATDAIRTMATTNTGSMVLCPCLGNLSGLNTVPQSQKQPIIDNMNSDDKKVNDLFVEAFITNGDQNLQNRATMDRYNFKLDQLNYWSLFFAFKEKLSPYAGDKTMHRHIGGDFTFAQTVFDNNLLIPAKYDASFMNASRLAHGNFDDDEVSAVWISHSVSLCYDLLITALAYLHNPESPSIVPPAPPPSPDFALDASLFTWTDECTSADCGYPNLNNNPQVQCPGEKCTWCVHFSGITGPNSINNTFPEPTPGWEINTGIAWGELNGPAAELNARMFCTQMATCTGYYWGAAGGCISISSDEILQDVSKYSRSSASGGQAYNILPNTFYKFMRKGTYTEANVQLNVNAAHGIEATTVQTHVFSLTPCVNGNCTPSAPGYRFMPGYDVHGDPEKTVVNISVDACAIACDKSERCLTFKVNNSTCTTYSTDHVYSSSSGHVYLKSTSTSQEFDDAEQCKLACTPAAQCDACIQAQNGKWYNVGVGGFVDKATQKWTRIGTDSAGYCRRTCWDDDTCMAWTWSGTSCQHVKNFSSVAYGIKPNLAVVRALGFSDTLQCPKPGELFDLCSQMCVNIQNHLEAGWCNNNWVNCQDGPFATSSRKGVHLCTGSSLYVDTDTSSIKAHVPENNNGQVKNPALAESLAVDITVQHYGEQTITGAFEGDSVTRCALGAGSKTFNTRDKMNNFVDNVMTQSEQLQAINFIAAPQENSNYLFRSAWGSNRSLTDCTNGGCRFGTCVLGSQQTPMYSYTTTSKAPKTEIEKNVELSGILNQIQYTCPDSSVMNVHNVSSSIFFRRSIFSQQQGGNNAPCCKIGTGGAANAWTPQATCSVESGAGDLKYMPASCSSGLYVANTRPTTPMQPENTYHISASNIDMLPKDTCQSTYEPSLSVFDLMNVKILENDNLPSGSVNGNLGGSREDALDLQYICPFGVTTATDPENTEPFTERVKGSLAQLTLKCPHKLKFKRPTITKLQENSDGRCRYSQLNDELDAVQDQNSQEKQYNYYPFDSPWIGAAMQYAAKCVRYDFECLENMPADDKVCGVHETGTCGLSDNGQSAHTAQSAAQKCSQMPMEMCPLPGYTVKWTNGTLGCVPIGSTGVFDSNTDTHDIPFWPGFAHKKGSNAGIGPAWFNKHAKCSNTDKCGGISDCGPPVTQNNNVLEHLETCQIGLTDACCNERAWHDPITIAQQGACTIESCIAKPSMQCIGAQWETCNFQTGSCSAGKPSCCTCKPTCKTSKQSQTMQLVTIGHANGNVCGTTKTHIAQSVAWGNGTSNVLSCNGEADMTAGALWRGNAPSCGCALQLKHEFRLTAQGLPPLQVQHVAGQVECYYACDTDPQCYGCAKHNNGTWNTATISGYSALQEYTVYRKTNETQPCCDAKLSCAYEQPNNGHCPPHANGCGQGGSVCETQLCEKCVCVCDEGFTGPYCDQCRDPNKDLSSKCTTCLGNWMQDLDGECTVCKPGFTRESGCTKCTPFMGPDGKCDTRNCTMLMNGATTSSSGVMIGYNTDKNQQLFDGTKGIPFGKVPIGVQYSVVLVSMSGVTYWVNNTHKHIITNVNDVHYKYTLTILQEEWFNSLPAGTDTTTEAITEDMSIAGRVCPNTDTEHRKTETANACATSCSGITGCVAWYWAASNNACQIVSNIDSQLPTFSFGALLRSYSCSNGGLIGAGPNRDRVTIQNDYFADNNLLSIKHLTGKYVASFADPRQMYLIGRFRRYEVGLKCPGDIYAVDVIAQTCSQQVLNWAPIMVRDDWLQTVVLAPTQQPINMCSAMELESFSCQGSQEVTEDDFALQVSPTQFVVDPAKAVYTESMDSITSCCVSCNNMFSSNTYDTLRYWSYKGTTCVCYESIKSSNVPFKESASSSHVVSECNSNVSATGEIYTLWDKNTHPNGCNPRVFMTDVLQHPHNHCLDKDRCVQLAETSNVHMFTCKEQCIQDSQCTGIEWQNSTRTCTTFQCDVTFKWPVECDANSTYLVSVKTGGCVPGTIANQDVCVQKKLTGEYVGAVEPDTCTAYGNDVTAHHLDVHVALGAQSPVEVQAEYKCANDVQNATWGTMPIVPGNTHPLVISDLTDALYFHQNIPILGTALLTGLQGGYTIEYTPIHLDIQTFTQSLSSVFTINFGDNFDSVEQIKMSQIIPHAQLELSGDSACFQQAEYQVQQAMQTQEQTTQCVDDVCVKASHDIDDYINHFLDTLESLQMACHMQTTHAHSQIPRAGWFVAQAPKIGWQYDSSHAAFITTQLLDKQMNMGPPPTPAPGAPTLYPTPSPSPFATAFPTPVPEPKAGEIIIDNTCTFTEVNNSAINANLNWNHDFLPRILTRSQVDCQTCARLCFDNAICSLAACYVQNSTSNCLLYSLAQSSTENTETREVAFVEDPTAACKVNNVHFALTIDLQKKVYVKEDCCI